MKGSDGREWTVRRRLAPRLGQESLWGRFHKQFRVVVRRTGDMADLDPGCLEVFGEGLVVGIAIILGLLFLFFVAIPLLVAVLDVLIVAVLAVLGIAARVVFRRPWVVEARAEDGETLRWRVVGWKASGARVENIAKRIRGGLPLSGTA